MPDLSTLWDRYAQPFADGTAITLQITAVGLAIGLVTGLPLAVARIYGPRSVRRFGDGYVEFWRGTPLLVQLFIIYYGLPSLGVTLDRLPAAFLALGLNSGAFQAEYFRGAILAIGSGQLLAARAVGMSEATAIRHIIVPQALRLVLPAWSNEAVSLLKATAVVFLIAVPDLMMQAKMISARFYNPIEAYLAVSVAYVLLVFIAAGLLRTVERKTAIPGVGSMVTRA